MPAPAQSLRARREAVVAAHVDAENRHDLDALLASFERPRYEVVPLGTADDGAAAVRQLIGGLLEAFPDFHFYARRLHHADDVVLVEGRFTGTHRAAWAGVPATGRSIDVPAACVFEFEGAGCVCERVYFDFATLLRQLGALPG
jgi:steroid delta-isomerase-like uncharacterized protein